MILLVQLTVCAAVGSFGFGVARMLWVRIVEDERELKRSCLARAFIGNIMALFATLNIHVLFRASHGNAACLLKHMTGCLAFHEQNTCANKLICQMLLTRKSHLYAEYALVSEEPTHVSFSRTQILRTQRLDIRASKMSNNIRVPLMNNIKGLPKSDNRLSTRKLTHFFDSLASDTGTSPLIICLFITCVVLTVILINTLPKRIRAWGRQRQAAAGRQTHQ